MDTNYKLYLYKPAGQESDFLGELLVDNLNAQIKLHDISTISFTIPESINGVANTRLDEVLDSYVVELRYGKDVILDNGEHSKIRFTIFSTPLEFSENIRKYSYSGYSLESLLEFKNITNWAGIEVKDFFRTVKYNNNAATPRFTEPGTPSNFSYTISTSSNTRGTKYITVSPTTATATPLDIFIYEVRQDTTVSGSVKEVPYARYTGTGVNDTNFRDGYYFLNLNGSGNVTSIIIAVPGNYDNFNGLASTTELFFKIYDNPLSRHFAIGVNRTTEDPYTDMYVDLAHQANLGDATPTYGDYTFSTQTIYSKNGLKLEQVLLGRTDTRDGSYNLINNTATRDGLLYSTGFTIGTIDPVIAGNAAETILPMYRSNLEFNNITRYQAIKDLAESFDAIAVFNTVAKTVSFYPQDNSLTTAWPNNGLIIKYGTYLQSITKEIDASKIVTSAKALGKDNLTISLITPDGNDAWEDFSYYLDSYYISDASTQIQNIQNNGQTGITFSYVDKTNYQSRWMEVDEAEKVAKWQYARDYFHQILLGELNPSINDHDKYFDLYNLRSEAINNYVTAESEFIAWRAEQYRYKYLYDYYYNLKQNGGVDPNDLDRLDYYQDLWLGAQVEIASKEQEIEDLRKEIFPATQDEIVPDSIADYLSHVKNFLDKEEWGINLTKLEPFIRQTVMSDNKLDNDLDLLKATITHVNENKVPKVTLKTNIVSIISAQEAYEDWNKLKTGDLINIYFDEFNIDLVAQIKEVSIDFEEHKVDLTISTVHNYNTGFGRYVTKTLRRLYNSDTNVTKHLEDANRISSAETAEVYNQLNNGSISADNSQITLGSTNSEGTQSTSFSATGVNSLVIESVDAVLEIPTFSADKGVAIADGTITAYYNRGAGDITTEVEISGANGFAIRNTDNDTGTVTTVAYIDEGTGEAYFAGWKLEEGQFSGAGTGASFVAINSEDPLLETGTENKTYAFWAGDETASDAPFNVTKAGAIKATSGTISGLTIGTGTYVDPGTSTSYQKNAIYAGDGIYGDNDTPFYLDQDGRFSLSNELKWDPNYNGGTFFVNGTIEATVGQIGGWKVGDNTLTSVDDSNVLTPKIQLRRNGNIYVGGTTFGGTNNEYIIDPRITINENGIVGKNSSNTTTFNLDNNDGLLKAVNILLENNNQTQQIEIGNLNNSIAGNYGFELTNNSGYFVNKTNISFDSTDNSINNPGGAGGLDFSVYQGGNKITVSNSALNDGTFTVQSSSATKIIVASPSVITTESAGASITLARIEPYKVSITESGFFITTVDAINDNDTAMAVDYNSNRIWAKRLLIADFEDESLASTIIGTLGNNIYGVRVAQTYESGGTKYNTIKMTNNGFSIKQGGTIIDGGNTTFEVKTDGSISATSLKITGTSELGGWTVGNTSFQSNNYNYTSTNFSTDGIKFNNNGTIIGKQFAINSSGDAFFRGNLDAASGTFGTIAADKGNVLLGGSDPLVVRNNETNILRLTNAGVLTIGNWTVDETSISAANLVLQYHATNPYISIGQTTEGYDNTGAFFGLNSAVAKFSLKGEDPDPNYLKWDGEDLLLKGNLAGEISAINIYKVVDDVPDTAIGVRITSDGILGENTGLRSFELRAFDGRGQIAGWNFDSNNITSETNKVQLQKEGKILVGGSTIDGNGDVNNATLIIDGTATGASPVLDHDKFELRADGSAIFSGALQAATGTFGAVSIASNGSGGSLTVGTNIIINNTDGIKGNDGTNTTFQLNPDNGSGFIGGFNFSNEQLSATNVILRGGATPVLSFNQATPSSGSAGIYLGMYSTGPGTVGNALSLVNPAGTRYIKYRSGGGLDSAGNLEIKSTNFELTNDGNLFATSGVVGPLSLNNVTSSSTISFDSNNYTASGTINVISDSGSFSSSRRYTFINSPDINTRPFNISNFSVTYTTSGTYSGYWTLYAYVSYGTNIIKTYSRQSGNGTFTWSVTGVNTVATNILLVLEKIGGASLTFSVTNLVGVRFLPSMSLENFAVYPSGTAFSNLFQTKDLGIIDNNIETQDTFLNLKVTPTSLGGGGVSILHTNTIRDGILIQPNINFGTSSRRVTLSTPSLALTASRTIRFPDADGTLKLNAVYIADYSVGSNTYTTAAAALSSEWMMIELYRPSASNAKVYTFFVRVADVSLSDNTTLYSYSWGEPSDGPYKDTVTLLRAGTALAPTIAIKTNAGGTTTFRFYRNII